MKLLRTIIFVLAACLSFYFSHQCFDKMTGYRGEEHTYGGDAYTGMQNASAQSATNVYHLNNIVKDGFGWFFIVTGVALLGFAVPSDISKEELNKLLKR
ncbi:MAG: hypothetical protein PUI06_01825 [Prevotella sp.]|nr:hypothetical protein [Prevotella sp.]